MTLVVTGSIAFDYLMSFPGRFTEHLLPEHMHRLSLSFLVDSMDKRRGGCAPNIAYTLALLGERPLLMATAGQDFGDYRAWLEAVGIDTTHVKVIDGKFTASFFCSTDQANNQIASFYTGAMANAGELSFRLIPGLKNDGFVIVSPNDPDGMVQFAQECRALGIRYIWDPGQQCARMDGERLREGVTGAFMVILNDYELELLRQKTGMGENELIEEVELLVITKGEKGSTVISRNQARVDVPSVPADRIEDPTGVGDAFRGGFMKGLAIKAPYEVCARIGSVAATYALEHLGGSSHAYSKEEFIARYEEHFGAMTEGFQSSVASPRPPVPGPRSPAPGRR
jgi:adenosine kinase